MAKESKEFQTRSVKRICQYFGIDKSEKIKIDGGSRYLLADEVGLGKTIVARDVALAYAEVCKDGGRIFYVCGNLALIRENEKKLMPPKHINTRKYQKKIIRNMEKRLALLPVVNEYEKEFNKLVMINKAVALIILAKGWEYEECFTCKNKIFKIENITGIKQRKHKELYGIYYYCKKFVDFLKAVTDDIKDSIQMLFEFTEFIKNSFSAVNDQELMCVIEEIRKEIKEADKDTEYLEKNAEYLKENAERLSKVYDKVSGMFSYHISSLTPLTSMNDKNGNGIFQERLFSAVILRKEPGWGELYKTQDFLDAACGQISEDHKKMFCDWWYMQEPKLAQYPCSFQSELQFFYDYAQIVYDSMNDDAKEQLKVAVCNHKSAPKKEEFECLLREVKQILAAMNLGGNALVIVDEFQNYADFFNEADNNNDIGLVRKNLLFNESNKVLLLSATPFHYSKRVVNEVVEAETGDENLDYQVESILKYVMGDENFKKWCDLCKTKSKALAELNGVNRDTKLKDAKEATLAIQKLMLASGISRMERRMSSYVDKVEYLTDKQLLYDDILHKEESVIPVLDSNPKKDDILITRGRVFYIKRENKYYYAGSIFDDSIQDLIEYEYEWDIDEDDIPLLEGIWKYEEECMESESEGCEEKWGWWNKVVDNDLKLGEQKKLDKFLEKVNNLSGHKKDTPFLASFAPDYSSLCGKGEYISNSDVQGYQVLETTHARFNKLQSDFFAGGMEKLLFIPPSRPYYKLEGVFAGFDNINTSDGQATPFCTKTLVFSRYHHTARALTVLLSYESERRNVSELQNKALIGNYSDKRAIYDLSGKTYDGSGSGKTDEEIIRNEIKDFEDNKTDTDFVNGSITYYLCMFYKKYMDSEGIEEQWVKDCAWYLYSIFRTKEAFLILSSLYEDENLSYIDKIHRYCREGCFFAVMDEYVALIREIEETPGDKRGFLAILKAYFKAIQQYMLRPVGYEVITKEGDRTELFRGFADGNYRETQRVIVDAKALNNKLILFNSPFRPFVFITTSVGAEGFDFHRYCRKMVHWGIEENPEKMQQKEGRIDRYHCHYIRQNLAVNYDSNEDFKNIKDYTFWEKVYDRAMQDCPKKTEDSMGLYPGWVYEGDSKLERYGYYYPASKESSVSRAAKNAINIYRSLLGESDIYNDMDLGKLKELLTDEDIKELDIDLRCYDIDIKKQLGGI